MTKSNILTAYFSRRGENYWGGEIVNLTVGNTELAAKTINEAAGGELFEIVREKPYPKDYELCVSEAREELESNARPKLKSYPESLDGIDTIFIGYPNWCGTCPMPVFSFLEHFDLSGKVLIPFCTNEGSGMGRSETDLKKLFPKAVIKRGLPITGNKVMQSKLTITGFAKSFI